MMRGCGGVGLGDGSAGLAFMGGIGLGSAWGAGFGGGGGYFDVDGAFAFGELAGALSFELGGGLIAYGVVGIVAAVGAELVEEGFDFAGVDGLVDEGGEEALGGEGDGIIGGGDANAEDRAGGTADEGFALGEVVGPGGVGEGVGEDFGGLLLGGIVTALGEVLGFEVVGGGEAFEVRHDDDVGELALAALGAFNGDGEGAAEDAEDGAEIALGGGGEGEGDGEDDVGLHVMDGLGGEVFEDAAIDVGVAVNFKGLEDAGEGDGGADGVGDGAAGEGDGLGVVEVCGEAAEGDGELVEVGAVVVAEELAVEECVEALVGQDGVAEGDAMLEADVDGVREGAGIFTAAEGFGLVGAGEGEDGGEDLVVHDGLELLGGAAG